LQVFKLLLEEFQQFKVYPLYCVTFITNAILKSELEHVKMNPDSSQSEYIRLVLHHWTWPLNSGVFEKNDQHRVKRNTIMDENVPHTVFWSYLIRLDAYITLITLFYPHLLQRKESTVTCMEGMCDKSQFGTSSTYKEHDLAALMKHWNHLEFSLRYN
jgi:hypothetical protein